ncbi:MAG TPA: FmdE family protein [Dehalococcoidales bacterium]|nr:FmdE family protein [Dehalococcoidales bacterium]
MNEFETFLKKAGDFHGHVCAGIALGTRISLAALHELGMKPGVRNKNLIVYAEIDRCMTDAVMIVTHCSLGRRSLKHIDYGKFAATFVDTDTGKAVRATIKEHFSSEVAIEDTLKKLAGIPDKELVTIEQVTVKIPETDLPGPPKDRATCASCGEIINDGRDVKRGKKVLCRACANGGYYNVAN